MVSFVEKIETLDFDVFVIVVQDAESSFLSEKLQKINNELINGVKNFNYKDITKFKLSCNNKITEVIVVGAGKRNQLTLASIEKLGGYIYSQIDSENAKVCVLNNIESVNIESATSLLASGMLLKSWKFDKYFSKKTQNKITSITCQTNYVELNKEKMSKLDQIRTAVFDVRDMVTEPANVMTPDKLKDIALDLENLGIKVTVLDRKNMEKLGMNALLGVAKGSDNSAYTVVMEYLEGGSNDTVALVGKGVTFDSGGLSLKPSKGMGEMKGDMTGAAVVIGTIKALALQHAKVNVIGAIGIVENVINGKAQKPGDVVKAMSGTTIEVDDTDAEGRLVLADVLYYTQSKYKPSIVIDFATLTGAIQVALGHEFAGYMSNSDELSKLLESSSSITGEKIWRLPLHDSYEPDIKSDIADIKNVGSGRGAGSITAAMFLQHFIINNAKWAHIDIAATEWDPKDRALSQKGATGFGVRLMCDFLKNFSK